MNISGIRINPAFNAGVNDPGWVTIPVPTGAGNGKGSNPGDLQLDLLQGQTGATIFNVGGVPQATYQSVQILVDPNIPGTIVPACQAGTSNTEGCINYPIQAGNVTIPIIFSLGTPLTTSPNTTSPLVIQLAVTIDTAPVNTGDSYVVTITPSEVNLSSFLAQVSGSIQVKGTSSGKSLGPLTVSAELSGTNNVIETVPLKAKSVYTLELPASPSGTLYDIFTSGGGDTYATLQNVLVTPGLLVSNPKFNVSAVNTTSFAGTVNDDCTSLGIPGAQLELLVPATAVPTPTPPTPSATPVPFCLANPEQCVVVASAFTDQSGNYPLPGTSLLPTGFDVAPLNQANLAVRVTASGYSSLLSSVLLKGNNNQICSAATSDTRCNFSLTTGFINGTANLVMDPPPGDSVMVQVFAENQGTNQIVSALAQPLVFLNNQTSRPFTLNVPISGAGPNFDLFAVAIDPYLGGTAPFPGHDISVLADIAGPTSRCASIPPASTPSASPTPLAMPAMNCVGHGSISGTVQNPDTGTTVSVEKQGVQITGTSPGLLSSDNPGSNNQYSLCVPPDDYTLQRFEAVATSSSSASPTPSAVGSPQPITVPQPASTSSPCPSTCSNSNSGPGPCPGICFGKAASPL